MRRPLWQRACSALMGLWFAAAITGIGPIQLVDADGAAMMHGSAMPGMDHSAPSGHCDHAMDPGSSSAPTSVPGAPANTHCGGCLAACCATGVVTLATGRVAPVLARPVVVSVVSRPPASRARPGVAYEVVLHPPLGPPALNA